MDWDLAFEAECHGLVARVCDDQLPAKDRDRAWRGLLARIGPPIEAWAEKSRLLRRAGLGNPDDARAVLVAVLERLAAGDFENLRLYLARRPPAPSGDDLDGLVRLADDRDEDDDEPAPTAANATPLRAWLITLLKFVERDHLRARLGWGSGNKRDVNSNAARLGTDGHDLAARPPVTDALTAAKLLGEIRAVMATFPEAMRAAIELWMADEPFDRIAERLDLPDAAKARALVRAGHARLRERFRDQLPALVGG